MHYSFTFTVVHMLQRAVEACECFVIRNSKDEGKIRGIKLEFWGHERVIVLAVH